jgi:hypothetical protein
MTRDKARAHGYRRPSIVPLEPVISWMPERGAAPVESDATSIPMVDTRNRIDGPTTERVRHRLGLQSTRHGSPPSGARRFLFELPG